MSARNAFSAALLIVLCGCSHEVTRVTINEKAIGQHSPSVTAQCHLRLAEVLDQRPSGESGGLGWNQLVVEDAPTIVRQQLLAAGMLPADASDGRAVSVRLKQFYLTQDNDTKNPVVVYEAQIDAEAPFLVRAQPTLSNWWGSGNEARSAISRALFEANGKLLGALNARCPARAAG